MEATLTEKQNELRKWIKKIGLNQKYFAQLYAQHLYYDPHEDDIKAFYEKYKGHMKKDRTTTDVNIINKYLDFLFTLEEFKDTGYVKPTFHHKDRFSDSFNKRMEKISKKITEKLVNEDM